MLLMFDDIDLHRIVRSERISHSEFTSIPVVVQLVVASTQKEPVSKFMSYELFKKAETAEPEI